MKRIFLTYAAVLSAALSFAGVTVEDVTVEARIDSVAILIGEQVGMTLTATVPEGAKVLMPELAERQYITPGVEIVSVEDAETESRGGHTVFRRRLLLTSFDEDAYKIPAQTIKVSGKDYKTNPLALKVLTVDVDTTNVDRFFPPKDVQDNPFLWSEWSPLFWMGVLTFFLILLGLYLYIRFKQNKPIISRILVIKHVPPHQKALRAIEKIKGERAVSDAEQKEYYTRLTDTLRRYIEERFGFSAMEMTTAEIIDRLGSSGDAVMIDELRELFSVADLVKFAKYSALVNENDRNLVNAVNFIDSTKTAEKEREERIVPKLSESDKRVAKSRRVIKTLLIVIGAAVLFILCRVIYGLMTLI